jgi:ubiquinone/menaquinone biosynthesis C-methylase UbiE
MAEHVCPVWVGYLLASPIRKLFQNPKTILSPYVEKGMKVLDIGCAMGFFSLPLAQMVGSTGKVICVDVQEKMIRAVEKRIQKAGLFNRIEARICDSESLGLANFKEEIDFAFAFAVVHEVPDASRLFSEVYKAIKPTKKLLVAEPKGHISEKQFEITVSAAGRNGFEVIDKPHVALSRAVLLEK